MNHKIVTTRKVWIIITVAGLAALLALPGCDSDEDGPTGGGITSNWEVNEPLLEGNHFRGVDFINADQGWLVGVEGRIVHTANGGDTWMLLPGVTAEVLWDVSFYDADTGWAVGERGVLLRTTDGGMTWDTDLFAITEQDVRDVLHTSGTDLWAAGSNGVIIRSQDGGRSWNRDSTETFADLRGISLVGSKGVAVGVDGMILRNDDVSIDSTWTIQTGPTSSDLNAVNMASAQIGWAVGDSGVIVRTDDGGDTWTVIESGVTTDLLSVRSLNMAAAWVVGRDGTMLQTGDQGLTWTPVTTGVNKDLYDVSIEFANRWAVGSLALLKSIDGGSTWDASGSGTVPLRTLTDITFINTDLGFAVGYAGAIMRTSDGGETWDYRRRGLEMATDEWFADVAFFDDRYGWAVGFGGLVEPYEALILRTVDGGDTWEKTTFFGGGRLSRGAFVDSLTGWVAAGAGGIYKTVDGGMMWVSQDIPSVEEILALSFVDSATGWAVGKNGTVLKMSNDTLGVNTWDNFTDQTRTATLYDVHFVDADNGWAVGTVGTIWHTSDGGLTWEEQETDLETDFSRVHFYDVSTGWVVGQGGMILHTTNGGDTWTRQFAPHSRTLLGIDGINDKDVWIAGEDGTLLSTTTGGK